MVDTLASVHRIVGERSDAGFGTGAAGRHGAAVTAVHPRVHRAEWALARYGPLARRSFAALERVDPLADALVEHLAVSPEPFDLDQAWRRFLAGGEAAASLPSPVARLLASVAEPPDWVDWSAIERAPRLFQRAGALGGLVLSLRSLMGGYRAPAGNKPLVFTGRLAEQAPRRVAETSRFVTAVCAPGGLRPGAEGFAISVRVRLMHAQVRRLLAQSGRWDRAAWAEPINQHDMLATMLLFSEVYVEGIRILGLRVASREAEDWIALWRYVAWLMGTEAELLPRDYAEATALRELIEGTQGRPDDDSRALAAALLGHPPRISEDMPMAWRFAMARALCRMLVGDEVADELAIAPEPGWRRALAAVPVLVDGFERMRGRVPALDQRARSLGRRYWSFVVRVSLGDKPARFARPERLATG